MRQSKPFALQPIAAVLLALGLWGTAAAAPQPIDIPALPAQQAIEQLAAQTGLRIDAAPEVLRGVTTRAVNGTLEPRAALAQMLQGSGVQLADAQGGGVTLQRDGAATVTDAGGLQTITVNARKWNERMLDTPIAMSVQTGESLRKAGIADVTRALAQVPGVTSIDAGLSPQISVRGVSATLGANTAGYYFDDLPFTGVTTGISPDTRAWDLARVEVLRGPQGTLFGEGSMGGTIRITTNKPRLGEFGFAAQIGGAKVADGGDSSSAKAMINVPLGDKIALRVAATTEKIGGWIDDPVTGANDVNRRKVDTARVRVLFEPTDRLAINASYWQFDADLGKGNVADDDGKLPQSVGVSSTQKYDVAGLSASYDFEAFNVFYSYTRSTYKTPIVGALLGGTSKLASEIDPISSHELRATSAGNGPVKWTVGVYKRDGDRSDKVQLTVPPPLDFLNLDIESNTQSRVSAVFGEVSYTLPNIPLELTAGVRRFRDKITNQDYNAGALTTETAGTFNSTNPRFSVAYKPQREALYFATASKGFRSGIIQPQAAIPLGVLAGVNFPPTVPPDSLWTYELGTKHSLLDGRMAFEASVYHSNWKGRPIQYPIVLNGAPTGVVGYFTSEGADIDGVEASIAWEVVRAVTVTLAASYTDAKQKAAVAGTNIVKGDRLDEVPKVQLNAAANWRLPVLAGWSPVASMAVNHHSKRDSRAVGSTLPGDAVTRVDARLAFEQGPWTWAAYVDNVGDNRGAVSSRTVQPVGPGVTDVYATRLTPRTVGVELRYAFGR